MADAPQHPPAKRRPRVALVVKRSAWRIYLEEQHDERIARLVDAGDPTVSRLRASMTPTSTLR
jgi:NAD+ kinase